MAKSNCTISTITAWMGDDWADKFDDPGDIAVTYVSKSGHHEDRAKALVSPSNQLHDQELRNTRRWR